MPVLTKLRKIRKRSCLQYHWVGGENKPWDSIRDWITGWLMRYHKFALMKRQEEEEGSLNSRFLWLLFLLLPSSTLALISLPAFHVLLWGSNNKCVSQMCFFMHTTVGTSSLWCNAVKTLATSHWKWQHPEDRDFFLKSILFSCHKSMFMEKLPHNWEVCSMSAAGRKPHRGKERWQELCSTFLHCKTWVRGSV